MGIPISISSLFLRLFSLPARQQQPGTIRLDEKCAARVVTFRSVTLYTSFAPSYFAAESRADFESPMAQRTSEFHALVATQPFRFEITAITR